MGNGNNKKKEFQILVHRHKKKWETALDKTDTEDENKAKELGLSPPRITQYQAGFAETFSFHLSVPCSDQDK